MSCHMPMVQRRETDRELCAPQSVDVSTQTEILCKSEKKSRLVELALTVVLVVLSVHLAVHLYLERVKSGNNDQTLPRLLTQPQVKNVTTSTIEIEWEGAYNGDGPVCGFIVELKPPASTSWTSVGFVPFNEDVDDFEYTIEGLDAGTLYGICVIILHCSGKKGERGRDIKQSTEDIALPRLSTQPQVKSVTTSTIEIEWEGANDGDGPVCGFFVEVKPPASTSWTSVGFVPFNKDVDEFEYTIEKLDAGALYGISIITLYCSGREGARGPDISQSTEDHALPRLSTQPEVTIVTTSMDNKPQTEPPSVSTSTAPPCQAQNCTECPSNPQEDDYFIIDKVTLSSVVFVQLVILICFCVLKRRGNSHEQLRTSEADDELIWVPASN